MADYFDSRKDFLAAVDGFEPVQIDGESRSYCGRGLKRCVRPTEARGSGGRVVTSDVVWTVANETGVARPEMGESLSSGGMQWTIVDVVGSADGSRWICYCRQFAS